MISKFRVKSGFTLVELITTLLIILGLFFVLMPLGSTFLNKNNIDTQVKTIVNAIKYAKHSALLEERRLVLSELSPEDGWKKGMQLFVDNSENHHYSSEDERLREWHWRSGNIQVEWHGFMSDRYLIFSDDLQTSALSGYFSISENNKVKRKIVINRLGRVRVEKV